MDPPRRSSKEDDMCKFSAPKAPPMQAVAPPAAPPAPPPPVAQPQVQQTDTGVATARDDQRRRQMRAKAANDTLVTGGEGVTAAAPTATKSLYGQ